MSNGKKVLVSCATGNQGGKVARELKKLGYDVTGMTRKPEDDAALALIADGISVVQGDFDNSLSLDAILGEGRYWGAYGNANTWEAGVEKEEVQAKLFAELARKAGVECFVYTSVSSADRNTGVRHFENKRRVELAIAEMGFPRHVIVRPVFLTRNMRTFFAPDAEGNVYMGMDPAVKLQMVSIGDAGRYGALAFEKCDELNGQAIDFAGDELTVPDAVAIMSEVTGRPMRHVRVSSEDVHKYNDDMGTMFDWFNTVGYNVDIATLEARYGIKPTTFREWAVKALTPEPAKAMAAAATTEDEKQMLAEQ